MMMPSYLIVLKAASAFLIIKHVFNTSIAAAAAAALAVMEKRFKCVWSASVSEANVHLILGCQNLFKHFCVAFLITFKELNFKIRE